MLTYYSYLKVYELNKRLKSLTISFWEAKLMIDRYDNLVQTCIEKDLKRDELMDKLFQGGIDGDNMAILAHMDLQINNQYTEILQIKREKFNSI